MKSIYPNLNDAWYEVDPRRQKQDLIDAMRYGWEVERRRERTWREEAESVTISREEFESLMADRQKLQKLLSKRKKKKVKRKPKAEPKAPELTAPEIEL